MNQVDLFREQLSKVPLKACFPEYEGKAEESTALAFIREQFLLRAPLHRDRRLLNCEVINALDSNGVAASCGSYFKID